MTQYTLMHPDVPDFQQSISRILPELIALRHDLHRHPEVAFQETWTSERILTELRQIDGLSIRSGLAGTGIVATLHGDRDGSDRDGRCVALRAELDALPITEVNTFDHKSCHEGRMHACGHDGHMACLVGAARVLAAHRERLPGCVKFIFQPAEEHGAGGKRLIEEGVLRDPTVDAAFAMHGWHEREIGTVIVGSGPVLAAATAFTIELTGLGCHAGYPHQGDDVIVAASHFVTKLQALVARGTDPVDPAVVSICSIRAGHTHNVLAGECRMLGTLRALRQETHDRLAERLKGFVATVAADFGLSGEIRFDESYPSLVNNPAAAELVRRTACEVVADDQVVANPPPSMGGEDFAFFARAVPSAFWRPGLCPPGASESPRLHQPDFDFPDAVIPLGVELHCRIAHNFLHDGFESPES